MDQTTQSTLSRLVRVGIVMNTDAENHMVRVKFQTENLPSGWLHVLQRPGTAVQIPPDGNHYHEAGLAITSKPKPYGTHDHNGAYTQSWMPEIDDAVLCLFPAVNDGAGYVLGVV